MVPADAQLMGRVIVLIYLAEDSRDAVGGVIVAVPAPEGVLAAQPMIQANVVAVGRQNVGQGGLIVLRRGAKDVLAQPSVKHLAHFLHTGIDQAGRQNRAWLGAGLILQLGTGNQGSWRIPDTDKWCSRTGRVSAVRVIQLDSSIAEIAIEVSGRGNHR